MQMAGPHLEGSLAFCALNGVIFSSGWVEGNVALSGSPSQDLITLLVNLRARQRFLFSFNEIGAGDVAIIPPGRSIDARIAPGTLYLATMLSVQQLAKQVADADLMIDQSISLDRTYLCQDMIPHRSLQWMRSCLMRIHEGRSCNGDTASQLASTLLRTIVTNLQDTSLDVEEPTKTVKSGKIVQRAQEYVLQNLSSTITIPAIAMAAATSPRTLSRAFTQILDVTPHAYVRLLRLNRIRRDLVSDMVAGKRVSMVAQQWGINEFGRLSGWYRNLFGESPSQTLARNRTHNPNDVL
jgi:AraC-like DNA-binding protein